MRPDFIFRVTKDGELEVKNTGDGYDKFLFIVKGPGGINTEDSGSGRGSETIFITKLSWSNPICVIAEPIAELAWSNSLCNKELKISNLSWESPICVTEDYPSLGYLYNYYVIQDNRGIAPTGWHVPSAGEFETLKTAIGTDYARHLASTRIEEGATSPPEFVTKLFPYWKSSLWPNHFGFDTYGFNLLPGGARFMTGIYQSLGESAYCWTTDTEFNTQYGIYEGIYYVRNYDNNDFFSAVIYGNKTGRGIRLVRNDLTGYVPGEVVQDYDGNNYGTVQIGNQVWMTMDLKTTHYNNGDLINLVEDQAEWAALNTPARCYPYGNPFYLGGYNSGD